MIEIVRNLARRKVRSALTVSGIVIGIFALTTMGALSEHFNALLDLGVSYYATSIPVGAPDGQQGSLLPLSKTAEIAAVPGVKAVYADYSIQAAPGADVISLGPPELIGNEHDASAYGAPKQVVGSGRDLAPGERGEVAVGATFAANHNLKPGAVVALPFRPADAKPEFANHKFTVVGVFAKSGNGLDTLAFVSDADARMLLADTLPPAVRQAVDVNQLTMGFTAYAAKGTSLAELDRIATRINAQVAGVQAQKPSVLVASFKQTGTTFTAVMTGAALLALVIGGLSVVNTMIMAVSERVREIGLKKALGARLGRLLFEYLLEAMTIGALGGLIGFGVGYAVTALVDRTGLDIFLVSPRLAAICLGFSVAMATLAGIFPAWRAARLDPVTALRSQS
ncbi:MAG TPA: ABC transporter permease [Candidatus Dormibacteraeota bacterium]